MDQNTELMALCKKLDEESKKSKKSRIELTRQLVGEFIDGNKDKYLQLKVEAENEPDAIPSNSYIFSLLSFALACFVFFSSVLFQCNMGMVATIILLLGFAVEIWIGLCMLTKTRPINIWKKYILAVIDEFEQK